MPLAEITLLGVQLGDFAVGLIMTIGTLTLIGASIMLFYFVKRIVYKPVYKLNDKQRNRMVKTNHYRELKAKEKSLEEKQAQLDQRETNLEHAAATLRAEFGTTGEPAENVQ